MTETKANEYLHSYEHKGLRFSTVRLVNGNYGYIDHDGRLTTTPLGIAEPLKTEEAAISEAKLNVELRLVDLQED